MDEADATQDRIEAEERFQRMQRESHAARLEAAPVVTVCEDCGDDLPAFRVTHRYVCCVDCQAAREKDDKHYRRQV